MDPFLEEATELLDDQRRVPDTQLDEFSGQFRRAMVNAYEVFGEHAFRKWPHGIQWLSPINRPLFETWSVVLSRYRDEDVMARRQGIVQAARKLMTSDQEYIAAITSSTGDPRKVAYRFARTAEAAETDR